MGKKNKANVLGRALIKNRFGHASKRTVDNNTMLHTTEIQDGYDWGRLNLQSVTEESSFNEFLRTAELAGTEFQAEKLNITFVNPKSTVGLLTGTEKSGLQQKHFDKKDLLKIPRRPKWNENTTTEELQRAENESFLEWRRGLAMLQEEENLLLTPYEKNLEFWRQLWRVVERSDVVVQIVDARNPSLFRSEDLERYVKEVDENKMNMILINKADFLTEEQRKIWGEFFDKENIKVAFFSATLAEELKKIEEGDEEESEENQNKVEEKNNEINLDEVKAAAEELSKFLDKTEEQLKKIEDFLGICDNNKNNPNILSRKELIRLFKTIHSGPKYTENVTTIGLVGYPNVGKSSTINALMTEKKVSVSATPGKTKHFQTLYLDRDLLLCDCPGLVMPSFVLTKADMILNGILPIDQMRDHVPPINLLCSEIPRHILEDKYGIIIAKPLEGEDPNRPPHSEELLLAYGYNRGFMTANGQPDQARSARYVLKDYVNGRLLYCHAPPTVPQEEFHKFPVRERRREISEQSLPKTQQRAMRINKGSSSKEIDQQFFQMNKSAAYVKGRSNFPHIRQNVGGNNSETNSSTAIGGSMQSLNSIQSSIEKPWRNLKKEKREKLRKKFAHLDQH